MEDVEEVKQLDDKRLHWRVRVVGQPVEWDAEITDQTPDVRIAWKSLSGPRHGGAVLFEMLDAQRTRVNVRIEYEPEGMAENLASALGFISGKIEDNLERFKQFVESRGEETGAWRGEIHGKEVVPR
jgi:uncharacterized membrane protein